MILLFWIPLLCGIIIPLVLDKKGVIDLDKDADFGHLFGHVLCIILAIIFLIICMILPLSSGANVARFTTFYETNQLNYGIVVDETASYLSQETFEAQFISGSLEKLGLAEFVAERIKEWRDEINNFNLEIASYRYYSTHPFLGVLYPKLPEEIKPLIITLK